MILKLSPRAKSRGYDLIASRLLWTLQLTDEKDTYSLIFTFPY